MHLQGPLRRDLNLTPEETAYDRVMSYARVAVEWVFGDIQNYFAIFRILKETEDRLECYW